jgi:hypothetical protein
MLPIATDLKPAASTEMHFKRHAKLPDSLNALNYINKTESIEIKNYRNRLKISH